MKIEIVDFKPEHQPVFENLNRRWIEKYFTMEALDIEVLTNPQKNILDPGGKILVALYDKKPAGVVALRKLNDTAFELTKMAVDENIRRAGLGKKLMEACIDKGRELRLEKLILYSNTVHNAPAITLYRQMAFMEVDLGEGIYERGNIKMEFQLTPFTKEQRVSLIESYANVPEKIMETVKKFPKEMLTWQPPSGKWTVHENIIHLADAEVTAYHRIRKFLAEPGTQISGFDENVWVKAFNEKQHIEEALSIVSLLRKSTVRLLQNLPDDVWERTLQHTQYGTVVFQNYMRYCENHTHIGQMNRVYKEWLKHKN